MEVELKFILGTKVQFNEAHFITQVTVTLIEYFYCQDDFFISSRLINFFQCTDVEVDKNKKDAKKVICFNEVCRIILPFLFMIIHRIVPNI